MHIRHTIPTCKVILLSLFLLMGTVSTVAAAVVAWAPEITVSDSYYAAVPLSRSLRESEVLPFRSQMAVDINAAFAGMRIDNCTLTIALDLQYVTRSIYWGQTYYRDFWAVGPAFTIRYDFTDIFGLRGACAVQYCFDLDVHQAFGAISTSLAPSFRLKVAPSSFLTISIPLSAQFRKDIVGLQVGIALGYNFDSESRKQDGKQ